MMGGKPRGDSCVLQLMPHASNTTASMNERPKTMECLSSIAAWLEKFKIAAAAMLAAT